MKKSSTNLIVYQGEPGANSHLACIDHYPEMEPLACATFEEALSAVENGTAELAMIPIENSVAGRVADVHHLLPESGLYIIEEQFERIRHQLLGLKGSKLEDLKTIHSHTMALGQCRNIIRQLGVLPVIQADTAGAARLIRQQGDPTMCAIASSLAADVHDLEILKADIEDAEHNTTRFLILSKKAQNAEFGAEPVMTTFIFRVRNVPAALYKALGGFATNGVNMTKLESYQLEGSFEATMFYADIMGHPEDRLVKLAMEELSFFSDEIRILGTYKANPFRKKIKQQN